MNMIKKEYDTFLHGFLFACACFAMIILSVAIYVGVL